MFLRLYMFLVMVYKGKGNVPVLAMALLRPT